VARFPNLAEQPVELQLRLGLDGDHGAVKVQLRRLLGDGVSSEAYAVTLMELMQTDEQAAAAADSVNEWDQLGYVALIDMLASGQSCQLAALLPLAATRHAADGLPRNAQLTFTAEQRAGISTVGYADWEDASAGRVVSQNYFAELQADRLRLLSVLPDADNPDKWAGVVPTLYAVGRIQLQQASSDPIEQQYGSDVVVVLTQLAARGTAWQHMKQLQQMERYPPVWYATEAARQLVRHLKHAHSAGLLHLDIKPVSGKLLLFSTTCVACCRHAQLHVSTSSRLNLPSSSTPAGQPCCVCNDAPIHLVRSPAWCGFQDHRLGCLAAPEVRWCLCQCRCPGRHTRICQPVPVCQARVVRSPVHSQDGGRRLCPGQHSAGTAPGHRPVAQALP